MSMIILLYCIKMFKIIRPRMLMSYYNVLLSRQHCVVIYIFYVQASQIKAETDRLVNQNQDLLSDVEKQKILAGDKLEGGIRLQQVGTENNVTKVNAISFSIIILATVSWCTSGKYHKISIAKKIILDDIVEHSGHMQAKVHHPQLY